MLEEYPEAAQRNEAHSFPKWKTKERKSEPKKINGKERRKKLIIND